MTAIVFIDVNPHEITPENRSCELSGIEDAMKNFRIHRGVIITYNQEEKISGTIPIIPFWKYFNNSS
jgi:predicted AAA+ superfamily ATPase